MKYSNFMFVCTGNTCRSPMAAAIFQKLSDEQGLGFKADSCGTAAVKGSKTTKGCALACAEIGIDMSNFRSKPFNDINPDGVDLFCVMTFEHAAVLMQKGIEKQKIYIFDEVADPYGGNLDVYRLARNKIISECVTLLKLVNQKNEDSKA